MNDSLGTDIAAIFCAFQAFVGAFFHFISFDRAARFSAGLAYVGASIAEDCMLRGFTDHGVGGKLADIYAVDHQPDMVRLGMGAAFFHAMTEQGFFAHMPRGPANFRTILHRFRGHDFLFLQVMAFQLWNAIKRSPGLVS